MSLTEDTDKGVCPAVTFTHSTSQNRSPDQGRAEEPLLEREIALLSIAEGS